jgi:hypothetical protein
MAESTRDGQGSHPASGADENELSAEALEGIAGGTGELVGFEGAPREIQAVPTDGLTKADSAASNLLKKFSDQTTQIINNTK